MKLLGTYHCTNVPALHTLLLVLLLVSFPPTVPEIAGVDRLAWPVLRASQMGLLFPTIIVP
eukprot:1918004-Rhodomonas_salina.1